MLAIPLNKDLEIKFSISNKEGRYYLYLEDNILYRIEISYLGHQGIRDTIRIQEDKIKNFTLEKESLSLSELILTERTPIKIREDTITYRPEKFLTGEERKLRDILKKLPGLEVDRAGNVTVNGKPVTKLLVDGKTFFTGDEKLGVNNIPADVVDEIEALDNYNEVAFVKGLNDSEQLAFNICYKATAKIIDPEVEGKLVPPVEAWFAPEVPIRGDPTAYATLPGMILEVRSSKIVFKATSTRSSINLANRTSNPKKNLNYTSS